MRIRIESSPTSSCIRGLCEHSGKHSGFSSKRSRSSPSTLSDGNSPRASRGAPTAAIHIASKAPPSFARGNLPPQGISNTRHNIIPSSKTESR